MSEQTKPSPNLMQALKGVLDHKFASHRPEAGEPSAPQIQVYPSPSYAGGPPITEPKRVAFWAEHSGTGHGIWRECRVEDLVFDFCLCGTGFTVEQAAATQEPTATSDKADLQSALRKTLQPLIPSAPPELSDRVDVVRLLRQAHNGVRWVIDKLVQTERERDDQRRQVEEFWRAVDWCYNIEPREFFEKEAESRGFTSAVAMAVHWTRPVGTLRIQASRAGR